MTMITPSYLGETIEYSSLHACRSTLEDPTGIPLLDQLQGIGDAFAHQDKTVNRTELIIFIRPQIIRDSLDAHYVAEELRSRLRGTISTSVANDNRVPSVH